MFNPRAIAHAIPPSPSRQEVTIPAEVWENTRTSLDRANRKIGMLEVQAELLLTENRRINSLLDSENQSLQVDFDSVRDDNQDLQVEFDRLRRTIDSVHNNKRVLQGAFDRLQIAFRRLIGNNDGDNLD